MTTRELSTGSGARPGTKFRVYGSLVRSNALRPGAADAVLVRGFARPLLSLGLTRGGLFRERLVDLFRRTQQMDECVGALIQKCQRHGRPDSLGMAIDLLAASGRMVDYTYDCVCQDIGRWHHKKCDRAYQPDDDYWYVLLRAVGKTKPPADTPRLFESKQYMVLSMCADAQYRSIREAVVEALADIGTDRCRNRLKAFATNDEDAFIRSIAGEAVTELGE